MTTPLRGLQCTVHEDSPRIVVTKTVANESTGHEVVVWVEIDFGNSSAAEPVSLISGAAWHVDVELDDGSSLEPLGSSVGAGPGRVSGRFPFQSTPDDARVRSITVRCADFGQWQRRL